MKSARFTALSAALLLASVSAPALAANNALVIGSYGADGITERLTAAGYDVTTVTNTSTITDLNTFTQVWDLRYSDALSTSESSLMMDYLGNGGGLFLIGEHSGFGARNNSLVDFVNDAGGGGLTYAGNSAEEMYVNAYFNGNGAVVPDVSQSVIVLSSGTFGDPGNGTFFATTGPGGTGEGVGVAFGTGSLTNALAGRVLSYLDVDTFSSSSMSQYTALRNLTDRMIGFVAGDFQVDPSLPGGSGPTTIDGSQPAFDLSSPAATGQTVTFDGGTLAMINGAGATTTLASDVVLNSAGGFIDTVGGESGITGNISGTGGFNVSGGGSLLLSGNNTHTGGTMVMGNTTLLINSASALGTGGTVLSSGTLAANGDMTITNQMMVMTGANAIDTGASNVTLSGVVEGAGGFTKTGTGTLTLTGASTYSGGTLVSEGTLLGNTTSLQGNITNNATLQFDQTTDAAFAGDISGTGMLVKTGARTLTLTGSNSYQGGTKVVEGALVGDTNSLVNNIVNDATLRFDQTINGTFTGDVSGAGTLVKTGNGTLTFTGANSYTGGTAILGGTLVGNTTSLQGDVTNNATLQFDQATNGTFAGDVSGTGGMVKTGAGKLELTGTSTYTGPTVVQAGALAVNGTLASAVDVQAGARVMGRGTIGGLIVRNQAILAPGNSIDTLHVGTTALFEANSTYEVEVNAAGDADRLIADGAVTIEGGQIAVLAENGDYAPLSTYTIISGASVNGEFAGVTSNLAFLSPSLSYTATDVTLQLLRNDLAFSAAAATANQRGAALAVDTAFAANTPVYDALVGESAAGARAAFDSLSGEVHTAAIRSVMEDSERFRRSILGRFAADEAAAGGVWMQGAVARDEVRTDFNAAQFDRSTTSVFGGVEFGAGPAKFGIAGGYTDGDAKVAGRASTAAVQGTQVGAYAGTKAGPLALTLGVTYGGFDVDTTREIGVGAIDQTARASYSMETVEAFGEAGVRIVDGRSVFEPFVGLNKLWIDRDGVTETGASLGVRAASQDDGWLWSTVGAKAFVPLTASDSVALNLAARWQHALDGRAVDTDLALLAGGPAFTVAGAPLAKDTGMVDVGLSWRMAKGLTFGLEYNGAASNAHESHTGKATLAFRF